MLYSIDTSSIIHAWRDSYPPQNFPLFWQRFEELITSDDLRAIDEVLVELERKEDEVFQWVRARKGTMIVSLDGQVQQAAQDILRVHQRLVDNRRSRSQADPFVIALAQVSDAAVVTNEHAAGNLEKPNIPDVCEALNLRCINILGLIQEQGWVF